jgi:hypothetical protein
MNNNLEMGETAHCSVCDAPIGYGYPDHDYGCDEGKCPQGDCPCDW